MKRIFLTVLGILMALVVATPMASARSDNGTPPEDFSVTYSPSFVAQFPGHCEFPMQIEISGKTKTVEQGNGGVIISAPGQNATITNVSNGERATFNITGSSHKSTLDNGNIQTVMTGRNLLLDPVAGTVITSGRFTFVNDPTDTTNVVPLSGDGRRIDVCELLS